MASSFFHYVQRHISGVFLHFHFLQKLVRHLFWAKCLSWTPAKFSPSGSLFRVVCFWESVCLTRPPTLSVTSPNVILSIIPESLAKSPIWPKKCLFILCFSPMYVRQLFKGIKPHHGCNTLLHH
ncbi:hypothetical protein K443DRAFT_609224 [Laccaria amethystina LaAM-08-1]|uniref:Unplaced genomic scaffold K443scaffold_9, whole genome shotgun sequence n=1 Tax=Laccaria amethystina LaAM-08-1 TaxID=1095629 RepID=A0A0C9XSZ9_9AGAR|nr:hypothetical protein K443DRAFT_609224 [Laccaria amethystina LaAM-08-1]